MENQAIELLREIFEQVNLADYSLSLYTRTRDLLDDDDEPLSDCCTAKIIYTDICSGCGEHI